MGLNTRKRIEALIRRRKQTSASFIQKRETEEELDQLRRSGAPSTLRPGKITKNTSEGQAADAFFPDNPGIRSFKTKLEEGKEDFWKERRKQTT